MKTLKDQLKEKGMSDDQIKKFLTSPYKQLHIETEVSE
jgi:hypothetical protein